MDETAILMPSSRDGGWQVWRVPANQQASNVLVTAMNAQLPRGEWGTVEGFALVNVLLGGLGQRKMELYPWLRRFR